MKNIYLKMMILFVFLFPLPSYGEESGSRVSADVPAVELLATATDYTVGPGDILEINILQPDKMSTRSSVSPDGYITVPYIGQVKVEKFTTDQVQIEIEKRLADGYMKFPSVMVSLLESHSRKFFVYGAVERPGSFALEDNNMTILRAISVAGGFTRFGSSSRVKMLRAKKDGPGYETIKININGVMAGDSHADMILQNGDIIVISEGIF